MAPYLFSTILVEDIKMKTAILVLFISLTIFAITESCLVVNCSGVTAATCTSPCYQCGACRQNCCRKYSHMSHSAAKNGKIVPLAFEDKSAHSS